MAAKTSPLSQPLPPGTWDSHMHIVEPNTYPLSPRAKYTPKPHTMTDARAFYGPLGISHLVLVQPSIYGTDNTCMLDALRELTPRHGRAVVEFDPETVSRPTLDDWHALGVRGVRVNLVSVGRDLGAAELEAELGRYADVIRPLGSWVLQLYIPLKLSVVLEGIVERLGVKVCIDHFGSPDLRGWVDGDRTEVVVMDLYRELEGFGSLVELLKQGRTWVKLSAPYRISRDGTGEMRDLEAYGRELIRVAPERCVYATDWPHTRFENVDSMPFIEMCYRWCDEVGREMGSVGGGDGGDGGTTGIGLREMLFRRNAEVLWDVPSEV